MIRDEEVYKIGVITKRHGVRGELNIALTDDVFDRVEADYLVCRLDGIMVPFFIEEYRFKSDNAVLMKFDGVDTEAQALRLVGTEVYFPHALAQQVQDDEYSWNYFIGFSVKDEAHGALGTIVHVDDQTINTLFELETPDGNELLVPAQEAFIKSIDHEKKTMIVALPEGLIE